MNSPISIPGTEILAEKGFSYAQANALFEKLYENSKDESLISKGKFTRLRTKGSYRKDLITICKKSGNSFLILIIPLRSDIADAEEWGNTRIILPDFAPPEWQELLIQEKIGAEHELYLKDISTQSPYYVLAGIPFSPSRRCGILLHVSSLPGDFGIGDFGLQARSFIDFLEKSGQQYWQLLPIGYTESKSGHSPYSSCSAFAGNPLFIDPYQLEELELLSGKELRKYRVKAGKHVKYEQALLVKTELLNKAWSAFKESHQMSLLTEFELFKEKENYWLNDFALFLSLRQNFQKASWNLWPKEFRDRKSSSLHSYAIFRDDEIEKIKFIQFLFSKQWMELKSYASFKGIQIFGDIPIYNGFDSADVWAHPELYALKRDKSPLMVAGVPPDYFNDEGQLWGMPLYNWNALKKQGYEWWVRRIEKNLEWFDLVRLDHFRAFSEFWSVPADAETAINGEWMKGPGIDFFKVLTDRFPEVPVVAEDLGDIDEKVYKLRDSFGFPGMKVLQFGFGKNAAFQDHHPMNIAYNSIAYTGTHDNNTIKGWFRKEADKNTLKRIRDYLGRDLDEDFIHLECIRMVYSSQAKIAIVPLQDWMGLDEKNRMNFPATTSGNWLWCIRQGELSDALAKSMKDFVRIYGRY